MFRKKEIREITDKIKKFEYSILVDSTITIAEVIGTFKIGDKKATIPAITKTNGGIFSKKEP